MNNVVAHYEKYVLLYDRAIRGKKVEIDLIYQATGLRNEKRSAFNTVRRRNKKLAKFFISPQPNNEFEIRNQVWLARYRKTFFPSINMDLGLPISYNLKARMGSFLRCMILMMKDVDRIGGYKIYIVVELLDSPM